MNNLIQADIFFFITSVAVVLVTLLLVVFLAYMVMIVRDFRGVSRKVRQETELLAMDIDAAREHIKKKGSDIISAFDFFRDLTGMKKKKKK